jgi:HK97 family phage major capsid protein/HK97 family phage prohead protease
LDYAYSLLTIKAAPAGRRFSGIASTAELDRAGDSLDLSGVTFSNPVPLLWHHDTRQPIGRATLTATPGALLFDAELPEVDEPGALKARVDEAWQSFKHGVVTAVSIGFRILDGGAELLSNGARRITKAEICELSAVTVPANRSAKILSVKSFFRGDTPMPLTAADHIASLEQKRATLAASMQGILDTAATENRLTTEAESAQHAAFKADADQCERNLTQWRETEALQVKTATAVPAYTAQRTIVSPYSQVSVKSNLPPGTLFIRYHCAKLAAKMESMTPWQWAERWTDTPEVALALKAAVAPGTATDATWAGPLVQPKIASDFIELMRAATIIDQISGLYTVPFNTKVPQQTGGGTYNWVGEAKPKPVTSLTFASVTLDWAKVAGIIVLTQELVKLSSPKAEDVVRREMVAGISAFLDGQFINPAVAAVAGVSPASITNGAPTAAATTNPLADILALIKHFVDNNIKVAGAHFIMSPTNALALSLKTNADGSPVFPGIDITGGTYKGLKFIASQTAGSNVIALQPAMIMMADDGGVTIDASTEASLQMDSAPMSPADATTVYVSMFQANTVALRAERFITWKRINTNAVKYLTAAAYPAPTMPEAPPEG